MTRRTNNPSQRLIIFSRYPVPGRTKTRLIPSLGKTGAADLQRKFTEGVLNIAKNVHPDCRVSLTVYFEGGTQDQMRRWLGPGVSFQPQSQGSLGDRMGAAFLDSVRQGFHRVVLIGSDIPKLTTDHVKKAFEALDEHDLILGPSTDGGYWLVGMNGAHDIFAGMDWGTEEVLRQTIRRAKTIGLKPLLLETLSDMDTIEDIRQWDPREAEYQPYVSVIIPALNEAEHIEASILSARDDDAEIIVVDGRSSDNTIQKAEAAGARVETGTRGRALQQNLGAACSRGKVLLFLHADTVLPENYVGSIFESLIDAQTAAGAFRFKTDWDKPLMRLTEFMTNMRSQFLKLPYGDQGLFVRKSLFEEIGGFPPVPVAEDLLFVRRIAHKGRIHILPSEARTSSRRWKTLGIFRTTLINQIIAAGCYLGLPPRLLATLYEGGKFEKTLMRKWKKF